MLLNTVATLNKLHLQILVIHHIQHIMPKNEIWSSLLKKDENSIKELHKWYKFQGSD